MFEVLDTSVSGKSREQRRPDPKVTLGSSPLNILEERIVIKAAVKADEMCKIEDVNERVRV